MADYYPLIARAVAGLDKNTGDARRAIYDRARTALLNQLRGVEPALSETEITRERLALEEAIRKVEAESARRSRAERPDAKTVQRDERPPAQPPRSETIDTRASEPSEAARSETAPQPEPIRRTGRARWFGASDNEDKDLSDVAAAMSAEAAKSAREAPTSQFGGDFRESARMRDLFELRSARSPPPRQADEELVDERAPRSFAGLAKLAAVLVVIAALGGLLYWQWSNIAAVYEAAFGGRSVEQTREVAEPTRPKIADRVGQDPQRSGAPAIAPVAQRVVLFEEDPGDPEGKRFVGSAIWRTETVSPGPGLAPDLAVRADVEVPDRRITMTWSIRRNTDQTLPASHTIEITFNLPADFPGGGIDRVPGILMKQGELTRGVPLAGLAVKVTSGFFLVGLSAIEHEMQHNVRLLKERTWLDVPLVYNNGHRAILALEKGTPGERAFEEAFAAWARSTTR
jgi:hypothetical protein